MKPTITIKTNGRQRICGTNETAVVVDVLMCYAEFEDAHKKLASTDLANTKEYSRNLDTLKLCFENMAVVIDRLRCYVGEYENLIRVNTTDDVIESDDWIIEFKKQHKNR